MSRGAGDAARRAPPGPGRVRGTDAVPGTASRTGTVIGTGPDEHARPGESAVRVRVAVADGGDRGSDADAYLDLGDVPVRRAEAYVDVEHLLEGDVDSYVEVERLLDRRRDADVDAESGPDETPSEPDEALSASAFEPETGFDWVEGLSADEDEDEEGDEDEATESPAAAFAAVTGFETDADRQPSVDPGGATGGNEADEDDWSFEASLDPEKATRTRVGESGGEEAGERSGERVNVDDGSSIGEAGEAPLDLDEFVPGDLAGEPVGLDPEHVTRVESTDADEAVSRLKVFGPRGRRERGRSRNGNEDGDGDGDGDEDGKGRRRERGRRA